MGGWGRRRASGPVLLRWEFPIVGVEAFGMVPAPGHGASVAPAGPFDERIVLNGCGDPVITLLGPMAHQDRTVRQLKRDRRRFVSGTAVLQGIRWSYPDAASFGHAYEEIFQRGSYDFPCASASPRILDCGANVGLATVFWKRAWPAAQVVAVEADPAIFEYLRRNIAAAGCTGVTLLNKAVWNAAGTVPFAQEGADSGRVGREWPAGAGTVVDVPAVTLPELIGTDGVDLLKIDIEGAECEALIGQHACLRLVERVFVEYHSFAGRPQRLDELLATLRAAGFRLHLHSPLTSPRPFLARVVDQAMDLRLNIFAWRE